MICYVLTFSTSVSLQPRKHLDLFVFVKKTSVVIGCQGDWGQGDWGQGDWGQGDWGHGELNPLDWGHGGLRPGGTEPLLLRPQFFFGTWNFYPCYLSHNLEELQFVIFILVFLTLKLGFWVWAHSWCYFLILFAKVAVVGVTVGGAKKKSK